MAAGMGNRVAGGIGVVLWLGTGVWIAVVPGLGWGWKLFFELFVLGGCLNFALVFAGVPNLFEWLGARVRMFRRHG
jgi:hypothetical protein